MPENSEKRQTIHIELFMLIRKSCKDEESVGKLHRKWGNCLQFEHTLHWQTRKCPNLRVTYIIYTTEPLFMLSKFFLLYKKKGCFLVCSGLCYLLLHDFQWNLKVGNSLITTKYEQRQAVFSDYLPLRCDSEANKLVTNNQHIILFCFLYYTCLLISMP